MMKGAAAPNKSGRRIAYVFTPATCIWSWEHFGTVSRADIWTARSRN